MDKKFIKQFNSLSEKGKATVLKSLEIELMKETTLNRLKTNKAIQKYFSKYSGHSVNSFMTTYIVLKEKWITEGKHAKERNENSSLLFHSEAMEAIITILRKKLLIKICEWSANLIELEGVETSVDFKYWNEDVLNCPFLDLISEQEIDLYKQHFLSPSYDEYEYFNPWYIYYFVKHDIEAASGDTSERSSEPEFSMLYDTYMGTSSFWILPDKKCARETYYLKIYFQNKMNNYNKGVADGTIIPKKVDDRITISAFRKKDLENFVKRFESKDVLANFREYIFDNKDFRDDLSDEEEELRDAATLALYRMEELEISLPVEAADDYKVALKESWEKYEKKKILVTIDNLYEDYLFRKQSGISFERNEEKINTAKIAIEAEKNVIRKARKLLGEEPDLNIYEN